MKIKNVALSLAWLTAIAIWLWQAGVLEAKDIGMDLTNAIQHIVNVKLIGGWGSVLKNAGGSRLVWIETNNFILSKDETSNTINSSSTSNILWWAGNQINGWTASTVLWWQDNVNKGKYSTILWWKWNKIGEKGTAPQSSTIVWWTDNRVDWNNSVVVGWSSNKVNWNNSAVLWTNSEANWDNSVALWKSSINNAKNSFLWTDDTHNDALPDTTENVFVVNSERWMVVNANQPNPLAQLTIGWSLVIDKVIGSDDKAIDPLPTCNSTYKWVVKVVEGDNNHTCFCSCDGNGFWHSLYGQWQCDKLCNTNPKRAECFKSGETAKYKVCSDRYEWSCNEYSKPVTWKWSFFVDSEGVAYWSCQTDAWDIVNCQSSTKDTTTPCS